MVHVVHVFIVGFWFLGEWFHKTIKNVFYDMPQLQTISHPRSI